MATPQVPPRPVRSRLQSQSQAPAGMSNLAAPQVPPRPVGRRVDRSQSPNRDAFALSPLNDSPFSLKPKSSAGGLRRESSDMDTPPRPPSVTLPSIGQEGSEYANLAGEDTDVPLQRTTTGSPEQTRNVGSDLPLHAPKPSLSKSDAKARIATVTRTDSSQAAAAGFGRRSSLQLDDRDPHSRGLKSKTSASFRPPSSASTERPSSAQLDAEQGIPEIGQRVPMYPNAGDVQAPSPAPHHQQYPTGIGFHNDGSKPRHHGRTRSGREVFSGPPGSYGLHGHGVNSTDKFEKAWYDKHPEALHREEGQYTPALSGPRGEYVLSSEDLNKLVRETATKGAGFGTSANVVGLPDEQIGYMASEEYTSRMTSPRASSSYQNKAHSNSSQTHVESPLRKMSFTADTLDSAIADAQGPISRRASENGKDDHAEDDVIHIDPPDQHTSKFSGNGYGPPTEDLGPHGGNTETEGGYVEERGIGTPILASDELTPGQSYLQPAVSPVKHTRNEPEYGFYRQGSRSGSASSSRPGSRPGSIHGPLTGLARFTSHEDYDAHTPLEDVEEYEPLFPDEDKGSKKPRTQAERFRHRPDAKMRFPSQDIWEDTPTSLQLSTEVETPDITEQPQGLSTETKTSTFESPEVEAARKGEVCEQEKPKLMPKEERLAKSNFKPHIRQDMQRPGLTQRFPSRDIWEDSPDSARLETTVGEPGDDEIKSPTDAGIDAGAVVNTRGKPAEAAREGTTAGSASVPTIPPRPTRSKAAEAPSEAHPQIPQRPHQSKVQSPHEPSGLSKVFTAASPADADSSPTEPRKAPSIPDRPKPQVPARPAKSPSRDSADNAPGAVAPEGYEVQDDSHKGVTSPPPAPKPKPALPVRPAGSKIAVLQAGFMSDLDKRLKLGPHAPPPKAQEKAAEPEQEEEKVPLTDARKGRARGPARRKPAASPGAASAVEQAKPKADLQFAMVQPTTVWHISPDDGVLHVSESTNIDASIAAKSEITHSDSIEQESAKPELEIADPAPATVEPAATLATNTTGESLNPEDVAPSPEVLSATGKSVPTATLASSPGTATVADVDAASEDIASLSAQPATAVLEPDAGPQQQQQQQVPLGNALDEQSTAKAPRIGSTDAGAQTGATNVVISPGSPDEDHLTVFEGGLAVSGGNAVVRECKDKGEGRGLGAGTSAGDGASAGAAVATSAHAEEGL